MFRRTAIGVLLAVSLQAAEFQTGQAARAVIGQPGFSAREAGVPATALALDATHLYAAEPSGHILTFDVSGIPSSRDDMSAYRAASCRLCGFAAAAVADETVFQGIAAVSSLGHTVVGVDATHHHVLIWRDTSGPNIGPDIILGRSDSAGVSAYTMINPVSVAFDGKRVFVGDAALHRVLVWNSVPASNDQPPDAVLGQPDFVSSDVAEIPRADSIRFPVALASDGTNLYVADSVDRRILVFTPGDTSLAENALVNSATLSPGPVAPGTLVTIKGSGLSSRSDSVQQKPDENLPLKLAGVEVVFNGAAIPLLSVAPDEIQAQIPYGVENISSASLYVRTERPDGSVAITNAISVPIAPAAPGLLAFSGTEPRAGILLHRSGDAEVSGGTPVTPESPAAPGEVLTVWATGLGAVIEDEPTPMEGVPFPGPEASVALPITAAVNGRTAQVLSSVLPEGAVGVYEVRIQLPADIDSTRRAQLVISEHGASSNTIVFPVKTENQQ
jgi:uncharacterized protein (TIGR03437 family)